LTNGGVAGRVGTKKQHTLARRNPMTNDAEQVGYAVGYFIGYYIVPPLILIGIGLLIFLGIRARRRKARS
jgi:hypothetical protein